MRTELLNELDSLIEGHPRMDSAEARYYWWLEWKRLRAQILAEKCENCATAIHLVEGLRCRHFGLFMNPEFSCGHFEPGGASRG